MEVYRALDVNQEGRRAGLCEGLHISLGVLDHQVRFQRELRDTLEGPNDQRSNRDVRNEVAIHHIDMDPIGTRRLRLLDLLAKARKVGREDRRS